MTWYDSFTRETIYFAAPVEQYLGMPHRHLEQGLLSRRERFIIADRCG